MTLVAGDMDSLVCERNDGSADEGYADANNKEQDLPPSYKKGRKRCRKGANFHLCLSSCWLTCLDEARFDGDNTLKGYGSDPDLQDFIIVVQNVLRVSIAIDDAFPNRPAFISLIKEVFMEKAESIMRTKSRERTIFYID